MKIRATIFHFSIITALTLFVSVAALAQSPTPNIATSAVCTHSSGGSGTYAPSNYNDGVIPPQGSLPWGWTSGGTHTNASAWIMFEWPTPQTFGEFTFYHAEINRRYLTGADIQYWTGSAWVTAHTYLFPAPYTDWTKVVSLPTPVTSTRVRITNWVMAPVGQTTNPNFREIEIRNVCTDPSTDVSFNAPAFVIQPDQIPIDFSVGRAVGDFDATVTFNFYTPTDILVHSENTVVHISANTVNGTFYVQSSQLPPGFYNLEVVFHVYDICNKYEDVALNAVVMVLAPGQTLCEVWPGDVNNDNVVNYGDRNDLNTYIHDANLQSNWLNGPARYRSDAKSNPLTYLTWELQPGVPWYTPEGCYMDADGNGVVNNFDYIAIKLNWLRDHGDVTPKNGGTFHAATFDMDQNYPNPFNPTTSIQYSVPERSQVSLTVTDMLGRTVATLVNGSVEEGVHTALFDATNLTSGNYIATVSMTGLQSGLSFSKTIKMVLNK